MRLKFIKDDDFVNYKKCSLFLGTISCTWKCCKEANLPCSICQNYPWSNNEIKEYTDDFIISRYLADPLTKSIVFGGLEPMDQFKELCEFISKFRLLSDDDIVIYTGYNKDEIADEVEVLSTFPNIIIKFGRFVPNSAARFDEVLGIKLASDNQYAEKIS